eukprot:364724-Chlamydomonas_euryale.AAC.6
MRRVRQTPLFLQPHHPPRPCRETRIAARRGPPRPDPGARRAAGEGASYRSACVCCGEVAYLTNA